MTSIAARAGASGVLVVHSCPKGLTSHVEWALASRIGTVVKLDWSPQPLLPDMLRAEASWHGPVGTGAAVASSLFGWHELRFEITEDQTGISDGGRWMHAPTLGIFHMQTDSAGNGVLTEDAVRAAIVGAAGDAERLARELRLALGEAWDEELEPYRQAEVGDATIFALPRLNAG
ncbi:DUF3145 family protein [Leucobacter soli]|uniref:DUF3145 domain-containing protein n=1 Tax=Leucobacter soli TaxID=2812850 RepID=A0A916JR61_9MICO|nr:DUF3145 family protein [Leucobacter soli]CAG7594911.1 hypothetical protein LEUCIP111803_00015 [Leucobacter soli]